MNEAHDKGCPCFVTCDFCERPVAWDHMMEEHKCMKCRLMVYYLEDGIDKEDESEPGYRYKFLYCADCNRKLKPLEENMHYFIQ